MSGLIRKTVSGEVELKGGSEGTDGGGGIGKQGGGREWRRGWLWWRWWWSGEMK